MCVLTIFSFYCHHSGDDSMNYVPIQMKLKPSQYIAFNLLAPAVLAERVFVLRDALFRPQDTVSANLIFHHKQQLMSHTYSTWDDLLVTT